MKIIGIDPGTLIAGYGIIEVKNHTAIAVAAGAWKFAKEDKLPQRLFELSKEFAKIVKHYAPTHLCLELAFVAENPRSALYLGHARGVLLSCAYELGLEITEMSATSAKKKITGYGRADKKTMAKTMSSLLGFNLDQLPFDATDALGLAYARAMSL